MAEMFGNTWVSQYGATPSGTAGDTWSATLAGLTGQQLADGLRGTLLLGRDWPPSAPRFRALCMGIPTFGAVALELRQPKAVRSGFARLLWTYVDGYRLAHADAANADRQLRDAYDMAVEYVMLGGPLPLEPAGEIEPPQPPIRTPARPETAEANLQAMASLLGVAL